MVAGSDELRYWNRGLRKYGDKRIWPYERGYWEFQMVEKGSCWPEFEDNQFRTMAAECDRARLYCFHPNLSHGWKDFPGKESQIEVMHFEVREPELARLFAAREFRVLLLSSEQVDRVRLISAQLENHYKRPREHSPLVFRASLHQFAALIEECEGEGSKQIAVEGSAARKVRQAIDWYRANLGSYPTIESVAKGVGISATHLRRLFSSVKGVSPIAVFQDLRMLEARRLLSDEGRTVGDVAETLGYSEASSFSRAYKQWAGASPGKEVKR